MKTGLSLIVVSASNAANANNNGNADNNTASNANYVAAINLCASTLTHRLTGVGTYQVQRIKERQTIHGMVVNRQGDVSRYVG